MLEVLHHPYIYIWFAVVVVLRNIGGAFPEPDPELKRGFGSGSPGYRFVHRIANGMTMDLKSVGLDPRQVGLRLKPRPTSQDGN
jgi:hypothetical protein